MVAFALTDLSLVGVDGREVFFCFVGFSLPLPLRDAMDEVDDDKDFDLVRAFTPTEEVTDCASCSPPEPPSNSNHASTPHSALLQSSTDTGEDARWLGARIKSEGGARKLVFFFVFVGVLIERRARGSSLELIESMEAASTVSSSEIMM